MNMKKESYYFIKGKYILEIRVSGNVYFGSFISCQVQSMSVFVFRVHTVGGGGADGGNSPRPNGPNGGVVRDG